MAPIVPLPTCKALLLCDQILVEADGRTSLIGIINRLTLDQLPSELPRCRFFLQVTNALGLYRFSVEVHHLESDSIVYRADASDFRITNRLSASNFIIPIPQFEVFSVGSYDFVVFANDEELDRQTVNIRVNDD